MADLNSLGGIHYEIMKRCYNKSSVTYKSYGSKGIGVCEEWHDRENFKVWAKENGWKKGLRLERIDASKWYEPNNCKFGETHKKSGIGVVREYREELIKRKNRKEKLGFGKCVMDSEHGKRLRSIHSSMLSRCYNQKHKAYKTYGGRGIGVCEAWRGKGGFLNFCEWSLMNGYDKNLTLDRIDSNGMYCPENCRWATWDVQYHNKRNIIRIMYNGKMSCIRDIAEDLGVDKRKIYTWIRKGKSIEEIVLEAQK